VRAVEERVFGKAVAVYEGHRQEDIDRFSFSSRRRHTRSTRDWSSDVCSSDLVFRLAEPLLSRAPSAFGHLLCALDLHFSPPRERSEERRVGKEWGAGG